MPESYTPPLAPSQDELTLISGILQRQNAGYPLTPDEETFLRGAKARYGINFDYYWPEAATTPAATAPAAAPTTAGGGAEEWTPWLVQAMEAVFGPNWQQTMGLDVQPGIDWFDIAAGVGIREYEAGLQHEIQQGQLEINRLNAETNRLNAESTDFYNRGMLEEARLSREQAAVLERERMALEERLAQATNELTKIGLQQTERAYGAELGASPRNVVEYELWKRAGGATGPIEIPEVPQLPGAQKGVSVFSPKSGKVTSPGLIQVGEGGEWEYLMAPAGTVVAPHAKGEKKATMEGGKKAIQKQVSKAQYGYVQGGTHTDEEMARMFASAMKGWPFLYNPNLRGQSAQFPGTYVPGPQEMSRRKYYLMDPTQRDILSSLISAGVGTPGGGQMSGAGFLQDWLYSLQRSWIPGLAEAKRSPTYAY